MILRYFDVKALFRATFNCHLRVVSQTLFHMCLTIETFCFSRENKMFL